MKLNDINSKLVSSFKSILPLVVIGVLVFTKLTTFVLAHGGDVSLIHACIGDVNGRTTVVGVDDTCGSNETALDWIKNVFAGTGLSINRASDGATLSIADSGVDTTQLADNAITTSKIADGSVTQAKLASEIALTTTAKARAYPSIGQNLTSNTYIKVTLNTESYDPGNNFDTTNNRFVAPMAGYYLINGVITVDPKSTGVNVRYEAAIYKNGTAVARAMDIPPVWNYISIPVSDILYLSQNDYIELYAKNYSTTTSDPILSVGSGSTTSLSVHLLSI